MKKVFVRVFVILNFDINFHFYTRNISSKYQFLIYLICNNQYRHQPFKTHIGQPLVHYILKRGDEAKNVLEELNPLKHTHTHTISNLFSQPTNILAVSLNHRLNPSVYLDVSCCVWTWND